MVSLCSFICSVKCALCEIDIFNKDATVEPLKNKKAKTFLYDFIEIVNKSKH